MVAPLLEEREAPARAARRASHMSVGRESQQGQAQRGQARASSPNAHRISFAVVWGWRQWRLCVGGGPEPQQRRAGLELQQLQGQNLGVYVNLLFVGGEHSTVLQSGRCVALARTQQRVSE